MSKASISQRAPLLRAPRIAVIGGGGGISAIFGALTDWTPHAVAIVAMADSGGSTGRLRAELDIPPPGDLRHVMVAASRNSAVHRLESHRFGGDGPLKGHHALNMLLSACLADFGVAEGVRIASQILDVPGTVLPVTLENTQLKMTDGNTVLVGEGEIDVYAPKAAEPVISLAPPAKLNPEAATALKNADMVVIPGGSVYTSLLAALTVGGVADILKRSRAPIVMLCNLATEQHQTDGWDVTDFVRALQRHGIRIDVALYNSEPPTSDMVANYAAEGQRPVAIRPERFHELPTVQFVGDALLSHAELPQNPLDPVKRGLMRHDAGKVAAALQRILTQSGAKREVLRTTR